MAKLFVERDRYDKPPANALVEATHALVRNLVRRRLEESGGDWNAFVFGASNTAITQTDFEMIEKTILDSGHRFGWTAMISRRERPEIYVADEGEAGSFSINHPEAVTIAPDKDGREQRGVGDNVTRTPANTIGVARYVRTTEQVIAFMRDGVPDGTIAIIDDSGGTLTAPIINRFAGVICAGGTVRSHLGILAREYGIPCLMNSKISGILDGDRLEIETTAPAKTAEAYQRGAEMTACVWRLAK